VRGPVDRLTEGLPSPWRTVIDWAVTIVVAVAAVLAIKAWVVNPYRIPSSSMEPTLHCGRNFTGDGCLGSFSDRVLANRFIYRFREPERGEVVVFETPPAARLPEPRGCGAGGTFVKRLVGLPGDQWEQRDGFVYINGRRLDESYIRSARRGNDTYPPQTIPAGRYFMMGDNRMSSCDSRKWGTVPRENLIGPVFAVYWPPQRIGPR
jgi:signal peptidase I